MTVKTLMATDSLSDGARSHLCFELVPQRSTFICFEVLSLTCRPNVSTTPVNRDVWLVSAAACFGFVETARFLFPHLVFLVSAEVSYAVFLEQLVIIFFGQLFFPGRG